MGIDQTQEVGSQLTAKNDVNILSENHTALRQASVHSDKGTVAISSVQGDVQIQEGRNQEQLSFGAKSTHHGTLQTLTSVTKHDHHYDTAQGSAIDGNNILLQANNGNVSVQGSNVVAENHLVATAKNINIQAAKNRVFEEDFEKTSKSGLMGSGGLGFSVGSKKEKVEQDRTQESAVSSQVGSLKGHTTLHADNHYQQTGSVVAAVNGDVDILAKSANITAAHSDYESNYKYTYEQKGLTVSLTSPVLSAINATESAMNSLHQIGESKNNRINALAGANAFWNSFRAIEAGQAAWDALGKLSQGEIAKSGIGVSLAYGQQKSVQTQHTEGNTVEKSAVNAGRKVNIVATGQGEQSKIDILGSDVSGQAGAHLKADGDINIQAIDENHLERSKNKSSGFNIGVGIQLGQEMAAGLTVGGNVAKGYGNGESQAWVASQVGDKNSQTTIESGKDTNVIGSQVSGKRVEVRAENLNIESLQDTAKYKGKQESVSGQVTVGYGVSAGGSYSKSKVNSNYASVKTQAGIYAGDEGYDVDVRKYTELTGGLITSTNKAETEGKNRFSTGTLNATDIENHADYKGSDISVSGSAAMNFDTPLGNSENGIAQSNKQAVNEKGEKIYLDSQGNETTEAKTGGQTNQAKLATGLASLTGGVNIGYGSDGDSQRSRTKSGINTANIDIRDSQAQQTKTGKTVEEIRTQVKTEIHTDNAESHSGKLENRFDKAAVQNELDTQIKATSEFQSITLAEIERQANNKAEALKQEAKEANAKGNRQEAERLQTEASKWEKGGSYRQALSAVTNGIGLALGGAPTEGVVAGTLSPYINTEIKKATEGNDTANILAHGVWGAMEAASQGGSALGGAAAAMTGEVGATLLAEQLYGQSNPEHLSTEQKQTLSELSQVLAGATAGTVSGATGGNSLTAVQAAATGMGVAKSAVENNYLYRQEAEELLNLRLALQRTTDPKEREKIQARIDKLEKLDQDRQEHIKTVCPDFAKSSSACSAAIADAEKAKASYNGWTEQYQPVGYNSKDKRPYTTIFTQDYGRVNEALVGKDELTRQKEELALDLAKSGQMSKEDAYRILDNSMTLSDTLMALGGIKTVSNEKLLAFLTGKYKLPVMGKTQGYEYGDVRISSGAENVALYPKLKEQLMMENIYNLGKLNPKLREVTEQLDKLNGNINYGINGISTTTEANRLGALWVGDNATEIIDRGIAKGWMSQDKTRVYRFPSDKLHAKQSVTKFQANFETYKIDPISKERIKIGNAHLDVKD